MGGARSARRGAQRCGGRLRWRGRRGEASTEIEGLGSSLEEIQELAREEGEVNLVQWADYAQLTDEFTAATGCTVNTKDGGSSDEMISLMQTGEYDGVSASGNASVRLMTTGDVAPINTEFIPNYADVQEGIKGKDYNSLEGQPYGVPHGRGPNYLMFRNDQVPEDTNTWAVIWDDAELAKYKGKISIYDDSIFIADAALYLKATQPDLGIENPYFLDQEQFDAAVALLKKQAAAGLNYWPGDVAKQIAEYTSGDSVVGTAWPYSYLQLTYGRSGRSRDGDQAAGGNDRLVGHVDDLLVGAEPELHVPLDEPHDLAGGAGSGRRGLRRGARQPQGVRAHGQPEPLHRVPRGRRVLVGGRVLLDDPDRGLRRRPRRGLQDPGGMGGRLGGDQGIASSRCGALGRSIGGPAARRPSASL